MTTEERRRENKISDCNARVHLSLVLVNTRSPTCLDLIIYTIISIIISLEIKRPAAYNDKSWRESFLPYISSVAIYCVKVNA